MIRHIYHSSPSSVAKTFRRTFSEHADSTDSAIYTAGYENIPVDVHVPILDIHNLPLKALSRTLSCVVIQGTFSVERRDYLHFFADLITSLRGEAVILCHDTRLTSFPCVKRILVPGGICLRWQTHLFLILIHLIRPSKFGLLGLDL